MLRQKQYFYRFLPFVYTIHRHMIMRELAPTFSIPYPLAYQPDDLPFVPTAFGTRMELRCVIAVIRHGDRTPKQKMKMAVLHPLFV